MHLLRTVENGKGGRGAKGGLSEYAKRVNMPQQTLNEYRQAAEVLDVVGKPTEVQLVLTNKPNHLRAIHAAPREAWAPLVERMLEKEADEGKAWTVTNVKSHVATVKEYDIPERWRGTLP